MSVLRIEGSYSLDGIIKIQGSKNGVLPVMAASLLHNGTTVLEHVPKIQDVFCMLGILNALGADCRMEENRLVISAVSLSGARIPEILAGQMRSSVMLLGPLLARLGQVETSLPGGCRIGRRPVDLHFLGLTALGASVEKQNGMIRAVCPSGGLSGARIHLPYPSVGATENILMAAAGARGETVLTGAAREVVTIACKPSKTRNSIIATSMMNKLHTLISKLVRKGNRFITRRLNPLSGISCFCSAKNARINLSSVSIITVLF